MPKPGHSVYSSTPPWEGEHNSRPGIQSDERQVRLEVKPDAVHKDSAAGSSGDRSACVQTIDTATKLFQLASRPFGTDNRCLSSELVVDESLCKSSLEFSRQSPSQDPATPGRTDVSGSSNMAVSALVSSSVRPAG